MKLNIRITPRSAMWMLLIVSAATLLPFLGLALFNSKGEPREAIVAVSMLNSGDWILPVSNGDVIPYKPPFLAWCIAVFSAIAGHVSEYTSRLPSALALIVMIIWGYQWMRRNYRWTRALIAGVVTLTAFEVYRAGFACRVDMLLTMFIVTSLYSLYDWWKGGMKRFPWVAMLLMSGGMLTKGPVGILLPCLTAGIFMLTRGMRFSTILWRLSVPAIGALVIPAIWYILAYRQGGQEFLDLVIEENFGRFTGSMSYASHENPACYNVVTIVAGYLPYTLLALTGLFFTRFKNPGRPARWWRSFKSMEPARAFALVCIVVIFVFYCIPKSKRSVYLLPVYPFMAMFVADYVAWLARTAPRAIKIYASVIASLAIAVTAVFIAMQCGMFPYSLIKGRHALENAMMVTALQQNITIVQWILVELAAIAGILSLWFMRKSSGINAAILAIATTITLYWAFAGVYQPAVLGTKSDKRVARIINEYQPEGTVSAYVSTPMLRYFTANFYTGDRIIPWDDNNRSQSGYLVIGVDDAREFLPPRAGEYDFTLVRHFKTRSCDVKQQVLVLHYSRKAPHNG